MRILGEALSELNKMDADSVDAIITDPPYDLSPSVIQDLHLEFERVCKGDILAFCPPENQWPAPRYLFWVKPTSTKNFSKSYGRFVEMIALHQRGETFNSLFWANMTGVFHDVLEGERIHPYQKPYSLIERLVLIHSNPGDTVLDPFAGSWTTERAAENNGREFIGIELDPQWHI